LREPIYICVCRYLKEMKDIEKEDNGRVKRRRYK